MKSKKILNWTHLYPQYAGDWVAFAKDKTTVVAHDKEIDSVIKKAQKQGVTTPLLFKVPQKLTSYVGQD